MKVTFLNLIDAVDAATHETTIRKAIGDLGHHMGFQHFAYIQAVAGDIETCSNYPRPWVDDYLNKGFSKIDPVLRDAKQLKRPFLWHADDWMGETKSAEVRSFAERAISYGLRSGLTIPVEGSFGRTFMLTLASSKAHRKLELPRNTLALCNAVLAIHYNLLRVVDDALISAKVALSPRESEFLHWSSLGKRHEEIAAMYGVSVGWVQKSLDSVRKKLNVTTIPQAVAKLKGKPQ
ncbi:DNA-binding transcriptional regulator, CsgD family [Rhizobium sp. NFR07]|uniref:autoinducer binding domain-containing protein n=1 Tax=Rhizobium sp. NFR07 TaxID=1566262 RepID=UPI0008E70383|nr:autoinducer binding domain-containing protein [Rhizobium sp. NFR07]SFB63592.1 DNA-binding transcriptional regulator, CsgD family [Rhizobium sp. NFR07]